MTRPGIVSVSHEVSLPAYPKDQDGPSFLAQCSKRWEHLQDKVRELPWAKCPPEMSADFVRSMARELLSKDGDQAAMRAAMFTASCMNEQKIETIQLSARHPKFGASVELEAKIQPSLDQGPADTEFEMSIPKSAPDEAALDQLREVGEGVAQENSLFDPVADTPDTEVARLLACAERVIGVSSYETLVVAALPLLAWKKMEDINAGSLRFQLAGLEEDGELTLPEDRCVVFNAKSFGMSPSNDSKNEPTRTVRVRTPR